MLIPAFLLLSSVQLGGLQLTPAATPLLLTATLASDQKQDVSAPLSDSWQIQLQWLKPEQEPVTTGELIAVFNAGNSQSEIERLKTEQVTALEQLKQLESEHQLLVMEAEFELKSRQLLLEKAAIDAAVPVEHQSKYDFEKFQLEHSRARTEANKAAEALATAKVQRHTALAKQQLQIERSRAQLADAEQTLLGMSVYANRDGNISYALHPWYGTKLFSGATVQPGWQIVTVREQKDLFIQAWVHEVDVRRLQQAKNFSARFDIAPTQVFALTLTELAAQGEKRQYWSKGSYYRARFSAAALPVKAPLLGMGLLIEASQ